MDLLEILLTETEDEGLVTEVIRPAAVLPERVARTVLMELSLRDARTGGVWMTEPTVWRRYDRPFDGANGGPGSAVLLGTMQVTYGMPTRYEITIFRATITRNGSTLGMTVQSLCDEALQHGGLTLDTCPRADLKPPPLPFRMGDRAL
ncbi:MAG TPA: hypothetical protein VHW92_01950 [Mycobacteriales bacterium]|nr:hypothetical protein [Mycobacteriales bacterium]